MRQLNNMRIHSRILKKVAEVLCLKHSVADIFKERPNQWGFRGDPYLWNDLEKFFSAKSMPYTAKEFTEEFYAVFEALTGKKPDTQDTIYLQQYSHGGLSGGMICQEFWLKEALPLLLWRLDHLEL